ncbi:MAG: penicillin acylase family protein [Planctomycetota bacterium]
MPPRLIAFALLFCVACAAPHPGRAVHPWRVTIQRDDFGVPHVHGRSDADAVFGYMYARAEDEFAKIEEACFLPLGRSAEFLGPAGLPWDRLVHALQVPERAQSEFQDLAPELQDLCTAAADALNLYRSQHPGAGSGWITRFEPWHLLAQSYSWHLFQASKAMRDDLRDVFGLDAFDFPDGSNAFAIAPQRTRDGRALLLINPHLALGEVYEAHLSSDAGLNVVGGSPFGRNLLPLYGANADVAWALTVNRPDVVDLCSYVSRAAGDGLEVFLGGQWVQLEGRDVPITVRTETGPEVRILRFFDTPSGPIVARRDHTSVALAVAGIEDNRFLETHYALARSRSGEDLRAALARGGFLFHNVVWADGGGHIGYLYGGRIPRRPAQRSGQGVQAARGSEPPWDGYYGIEELPAAIDPPSGWLQNCNSLPWDATGAGAPRPAAFPPGLVGPEEPDARTRRSMDLLSARDGWTVESLGSAAFDPFVPSAADWIREIRSAWRRHLERGADPDVDMEHALRMLEAWDGVSGVDSTAATLFFLWFERYFAEVLDRKASAPADWVLQKVLRELTARCGTWQVPWGEVNRLGRPGGPSWPVVGAHGAAGILASFQARWQGDEGPQRLGFRGSGYVAVAQPGPGGSYRSILPYGQSRRADSPHALDQAPLYAEGRLKPVSLVPGGESGPGYRPGAGR